MFSQESLRSECPPLFLRQLLTIAAETSDVEKSIRQLLDLARAQGLCQAAFFIMLTEPHLIVSVGCDVSSLPEADEFAHRFESATEPIIITEALPLSHPHGLLLPVRLEGNLAAVAVLLFEDEHKTHSISPPCVLALADTLRIVTSIAQANISRMLLSRNQNEFVRLVSHDLRSLLTSIQGFASLLEMQFVKDPKSSQMRYIQKIFSGISQMTALVENIQDAGRYDPQTGFYELQRIPVDLDTLINRIVRNVLLPQEKQNMTIIVHPFVDLPILNIDKAMLERAIANLVDNAVKYTPDGGTIEIRIQCLNDQVILSVKDDGIGISDQHHLSLFNRHFRIQRREWPRVKGSGLGLFIVQSVARHHGGRAWVESAEGEGSCFYMSLPLNKDSIWTEADDL